VRELEDEVRGWRRDVGPLRLFKRRMEEMINCPRCYGTSLRLAETIPDHHLYRYQCNRCGEEFNA